MNTHPEHSAAEPSSTDDPNLRFSRRNLLLASTAAAVAPTIGGTLVETAQAQQVPQRFSYPADREARNAARALALEALLIEKGIITSKTVNSVLSFFETQMGPFNGAKVVARAWVDPAFRQALLDDATKAVATLGHVSRTGDHLVAVENSPKRHNMVVCTLCSCYPWELLGLPPVWYKSSPYRSRAVKDPRGVLADFGVSLPKDTEIRVWDSTAETRFLVLPMRPSGTEGFSEEQLAELVTRDSMIGTGFPKTFPKTFLKTPGAPS